VPKGTLRGSPPVPSDDLTTLRVSFYLVAKKKLDNDLVTDLTQALMNARRDLLGELPILAQVTAPDTDPDAYLPVHPGAAAYYNGTQQSFLDKWGNDFSYSDDIRRPRLGAGGGLEIPSGGRTSQR
jgi:NMT1-like family